MRRLIYGWLLTGFAGIIMNGAKAQERTAPVNYNPVLKEGYKGGNAMHKATAMSLPFFEDFTGSSPYPDAGKWADHEVYINNTMCTSPRSRGVATLDALNERGLPYDTLNNNNVITADSLTSLAIDLGANLSSDSVYLSFFYQPGGYGFYPRTEDSLMLFFRKDNGVWEKVWSAQGSIPQAFKQVNVVVDSPYFFYPNFQFRFVNKAAINTSDCVWNVDYIRMAAGRNVNDTAVNDVAFTTDPQFMLNDYTSMPYRQFLANATGELATDQHDSIRNNYGFQQAVNCSYTSREAVSNTNLFSSPVTAAAIAGGTTQGLSFPTYTPSFPSPGYYDQVVFENKFFFPQVDPSEPHDNDTIVKQQVFDNYLAYDDGTAELSYYLNLFPTLPGKLAIEYHLNQPDTLRAVAIYFGRQVPMATNKIFSINVYNQLLGINNAAADGLLYHEDLLQPGYGAINDFWIYRLTTPVALPSGTFYVGTVQPAFSGSDSLYLGLDANRIGGNHAYYNVLGTWESSTISGAIMIRPILGQTVFGTNTEDKHLSSAGEQWRLYPNPATNVVNFYFTARKSATYEVNDIQGRTVLSGALGDNKSISVKSLQTGIYVVRLLIDGVAGTPQKLIKQ